MSEKVLSLDGAQILYNDLRDRIGASGGAGVFVCTYGTTTYSAITTAVTGGKLPICIYNNVYYICTSDASNKYEFTAIDGNIIKYVRVTNANVWSNGSTTLESSGNKVTSVSAQSTDTQYPTAKCLYDIVGNIETQLASI